MSQQKQPMPEAVDSRKEPQEDVTPAPETDAVEPSAEIGGRKGPEPTRYGDWEKNGRCIDF